MLVKELMPQKPNEQIIYVNGEYLPQSQAKISVLDHGLMYGDGCFEAWCGKNGFIFELDPHLQRLYRSFHTLRIKEPMPCAELREKIIKCVYLNAVTDFYIKVLVTRGISPEPVVDPRACGDPCVIIYARQSQYSGGKQYEVSESSKEKGISAKILATKRVAHESLAPEVKSLNYLNIVLAKYEAWACGFNQAIMLDHNGFVTEGPGFNIMAVKGNKLFTPSHGILVGITRNSVMDMGREMGMEVETGFYTPYDLINADEVFLTNTVSGISPITNIDGYVIGDGLPGKYAKKFSEVYQGWLENGVRGTQCFPEAWKD